MLFLLLEGICLNLQAMGILEVSVEHALHSGEIDVHHLSGRKDAHMELCRRRVEESLVNFLDGAERYFIMDPADELAMLGAIK